MELRHLRHFVALAEERHFGCAAERVYVVQQALSASIRKLEDDVGAPLIVRSTRRVDLTPAGQEFLLGAQATLAQAEQTLERTRRVARGEGGVLAVGFVGGLVYGGLSAVVRAFKDQVPNATVRLQEMSATRQSEALRTGEISLGLMLLPQPVGLYDSLTLWREPLVVALPAGHHLTEQAALQMADLAAEDFVFFPRSQRPQYYDQVMQACAVAGFAPRVVQEALEIPTLLSLVSAEVGVFLPMRFFADVGMQGVVYRPLQDSPTVEVAAVWLREQDPAHHGLIGAFLRVAEQTLRT